VNVELVLAPNPGPYTGPGTNSYVISSGGMAVVLDPGPVIESHVAALEAGVTPHRPVGVLVTHTHPDHAPAANLLGERWEVPVFGFAAGPEFEPTRLLHDGEAVAVGDAELVAIHTPGHTADHLCYRLGDALFTGDHIMGGSTVIIEDAAAYLGSLRRVEDLRPRHLYPGHGDEIAEAGRMITAYIEHRLERERQIVAAVAAGAVTPADVVHVVYSDVPPELYPAAEHQVKVQLQKLAADGRLHLRRGEADEDILVSRFEES
jgi:glyoxylase-like metal-dependent hydrolase (beta-lactamase superfamily II)